MIERPQNRPLLLFGFAAFTLAPSFDTALKYLGPTGILPFFAVGSLLIFAADRSVVPMYKKLVSERAADILAIVSFVVLTFITMVVYPAANAGRFGGGSDADDALILAASELLRGHYPYLQTTYLGNLISPMPGTVLLATPFVLAGAIHLQNIFWLAVLYLVFRRYEGSRRSALGLIAAMLIFSPTLQQNLATGADYAANSIYLLVAMWVIIRNISQNTSVTFAAAILLGVGLSSRSTFILSMPLFLSILVQNAGWVRALKTLTISGVTCLAVTLPFWVCYPNGFSPLTVQSEKLAFISDVVPFAGLIIPGSAGILAIALSFQDLKNGIARYFRNFAIVQIYVLFLTAGVYSIKLGRLDLFLTQSGYGMFSMIFGATAFWMYLYSENRTAKPEIDP